jgi:hypothetical protein
MRGEDNSIGSNPWLLAPNPPRRRLPGPAPILLVDAGTVIDPFDEDGPGRGIEQGQQPIVADPELAIVRTS